MNLELFAIIASILHLLGLVSAVKAIMELMVAAEISCSVLPQTLIYNFLSPHRTRMELDRK